MAEAPAPAPLTSTPLARTPEGLSAVWISASDGARLRAAHAPARGAARGSVILSPGRTEPIEKYYETIEDFRARGFSVLVHDWRGQGLSQRDHPDPLAGHARGWRRFLRDYAEVIAAFEAKLPRPWIAVGHSMGGGLTALALCEGERRFGAVVLSAPMIGVRTGARRPGEVARLALLMGALGRARVLVPAPAVEERFEGNVLTHDEGRWTRSQSLLTAEPALRLGGITWGWLAFALALSARIRASRRPETLLTPVGICLAGEERLVDNAAARAFAARLPRGRCVEVEGALHEILMETDPRRAAFFALFDETAEAAVQRARTSTAAA